MKQYMSYTISCCAILTIWSSSIFPEQFAPGSDDIDEQQILRQIESEIGLNKEISKESNPDPKEETTGVKAQEETAFIITVLSGEGKQEVSGLTYFYQDSLHLRDASGEGVRQIRISDIRTLRIRSWIPTMAIETKKNEYTVLFMPHECTVELSASSVVNGIIDGENWIQIIIRDNGEKKPIPLSYHIPIKAPSREEALALAKKQTGIPEGQYTNIVFKETRINEVSSSNKQ
ncbi:hypothetical protein Lepil_0388 [Leptonema illini DSM 21528]|uniref:Uncharacterized protein n=2 Tax=Leptonema illini TaxID=183 RepID=H2CKN9_9LEPT|nr:hypothetical protein Lepil_0388 [Leptonema illini DSM 21528]